MSSIHYKFRSALQYKTLTFDGLHISLEELKKMIMEKENIKAESFDLVLQNSHTKREYMPVDLVPRNSSVLVQRIPRENAAKLPKVQDTTFSGIVTKNGNSSKDLSAGYIQAETFAKMSESERLDYIKDQSSLKYQPSNYQKKPSAIMSGPPPPTYICNRCSQPGHWFKNCPLSTTRRTTGIPTEELMETTKDDPLALLHPSGKFVVPIMHYNARQQRKRETYPGTSLGSESAGNTPKEGDEQSTANGGVPPELCCPLCKLAMREAVLATCCGESFCAECVQQRLIDDARQGCPACGHNLAADSIVPNKAMRQAVQNHCNNAAGSSSGYHASPSSTASSAAVAPSPQENNKTITALPIPQSVAADFSTPPPPIPPSMLSQLPTTTSVPPPTTSVMPAAPINVPPPTIAANVSAPTVTAALQHSPSFVNHSPPASTPKVDFGSVWETFLKRDKTSAPTPIYKCLDASFPSSAGSSARNSTTIATTAADEGVTAAPGTADESMQDEGEAEIERIIREAEVIKMSKKIKKSKKKCSKDEDLKHSSRDREKKVSLKDSEQHRHHSSREKKKRSLTNDDHHSSRDNKEKKSSSKNNGHEHSSRSKEKKSKKKKEKSERKKDKKKKRDRRSSVTDDKDMAPPAAKMEKFEL